MRESSRYGSQVGRTFSQTRHIYDAWQPKYSPYMTKSKPPSEAAQPAVVSAQLDALVEVLDQVRAGRAQTRPELMNRTGLSRAVVAQRVAELVNRGLLEEADLGASTGGRAPRLLRFRADSGFVLAADL